MKKFSILFVLILLIYQPTLLAEEYLWAGANQYQLWYQREGRLQQQLNAMQEAGLKVVRTWLGHREYQSWEDPPEAYTFENPIGTYQDANLEKVDYLMSECLRRGIKLIITFNNHTDNYFTTFGAVGMYSSPAAIQAYKNRISHFLNHHNSYLGKAWKDCNDVVYAWEIQNEPGIPLKDTQLTSKEKHDIIRNFLTELCAYVKSIDADTKVSLGITGYSLYSGYPNVGDDIRTLGNIEAADIYNLHFYGGNLNQWIDDHLAYCRSINKLLFIEEFGNERKVGMPALITLYQSVVQTCRTKGVPWMFWELGYRKSDNCYSINSDDEVWQKVVIPEAALINQTKTNDAWGINPISSAISDRAQGDSEIEFIQLFPNPFNESIQFRIQTQAKTIEVKIFNIAGSEVFRDTIAVSNSSINYRWHGTDFMGQKLSSGIYVVVIQRGGKAYSQKICLLK